jgi:hypothetical protein
MGEMVKPQGLVPFHTGLAKSLAVVVLSGIGFSLPTGSCQAAALRFCDRELPVSAAEKDRLFRFSGLIKTVLDQSGQSLAIVSRSGLDLSRFGMRYSHSGFSLKASANTPWSVRQLYFACDQDQPRIFDQGMAGFVLGADSPALGYVSIVLLPPAQAAELEEAALDDRRALDMLSPSYSANAYAYSVRYQNCNQWVSEMLAAAWGHLDAIAPPRVEAQNWLQSQGYQASIFNVGFPLITLGLFIPWLHSDDHPREDTEAAIYRVSMPAAIEAFVQSTIPGAIRIEFCHDDHQVVIRRGWTALAEHCQAEGDDTVISLE